MNKKQLFSVSSS